MTRTVTIGGLPLGGGHPVLVQSMTNTDTRDTEKTLRQIRDLHAAGCDLVRVSVYDEACAEAVKTLAAESPVPLVADIHFDYKMAIAAMENGADKIRINPGNIGDVERVRQVVEKAKEYNVPIRVGVNSGSLEKNLVEKYGGVTAEGIVESALDKVHLIEDMGYDKLVVSIKSSDVLMCVKAHELISEKCDYPLHLGVTEAGTENMGVIKSAAGIGGLLLRGIGNTIRISLTDDPVREVEIARELLKALGAPFAN